MTASAARDLAVAPLQSLLSSLLPHISSAARVLQRPCAPCDGIDDRADSDDLERLRAPRGGVESGARERRAARRDPGARPGARARRSVGERRIPRRASAELHRRAHARNPDKLARAAIIDISQQGGSTIQFGARVKLVDEETDEEAVYQIVGPEEAEDQRGLLSITAPLGRALIGREAGDSIEVNTPPARCSRSSKSAIRARSPRNSGRAAAHRAAPDRPSPCRDQTAHPRWAVAWLQQND